MPKIDLIIINVLLKICEILCNYSKRISGYEVARIKELINTIDYADELTEKVRFGDDNNNK